MKLFPFLILMTCSAQLLAQQSPDGLSNSQIEKRVRAMKKGDVAWRKIAWKTCLVDALHESKKQGKPVVAWIFIDRPKDDERC